MFPARFTDQDEYAPDRLGGLSASLNSPVIGAVSSHLAAATTHAQFVAGFPGSNQAPSWLKCLLNDVGFGILILDPELNVCFCNDSAKLALQGAGFESLLWVPGPGHLASGVTKSQITVRESDRPDIRKFLACAKLAVKGQRKLILVGEGLNQLALALSPINLGEQFPQQGVLVTTERKTVCESLSLWAYGRVQGLTAGELKVLDYLAIGQEPKEVADSLKISLTTVRTHIKAIISKTHATNLRDLLLRIAKLPPIRTLPCCSME
jgi:DNA-binding CsgD family transcriptional regulator